MRETLLKTNRRAAGLLLAASSLPLVVGIVLLLQRDFWSRGSTFLGVLLLLVGGWATIRQLLWFWLPRLALHGDFLVAYVEGYFGVRVPLEAVECFFIGQTPSHVKIAQLETRRVENVTVVVRLAERATQWQQHRTNPLLAHWCGGYITVLGDWCEPLNGDVVTQLNRRLVDYKRRRASSAMANSGAKTR